MSESPYCLVRCEELILRDHLARDRTVLANERTFLAYVRTTLTLIIGGATFIQFFEVPLVRVFGWVFLAAGAAVLAIGAVRCYRIAKLMRSIPTAAPAAEDAPGAAGS